MKHSVNLSIAPVLVIIDDQGDPLHLVILGPMSLLFWLPCWLANLTFPPAWLTSLWGLAKLLNLRRLTPKWIEALKTVIRAISPVAWLPIPYVAIG